MAHDMTTRGPRVRLIGEVDQIVEPSLGAGTDDGAGHTDGEMRLACACPAYEDSVVVYAAAAIERPGVIRHIEGNRFSLAEIDGSKSERILRVSDRQRRTLTACFKARCDPINQGQATSAPCWNGTKRRQLRRFR